MRISTPTTSGAWWPPTRKIRSAIAVALTGDIALFTTAVTTGQWLACGLGILSATGAVAAGYLTSGP